VRHGGGHRLIVRCGVVLQRDGLCGERFSDRLLSFRHVRNGFVRRGSGNRNVLRRGVVLRRNVLSRERFDGGLGLLLRGLLNGSVRFGGSRLAVRHAIRHRSIFLAGRRRGVLQASG
jgi:hypothetical protein